MYDNSDYQEINLANVVKGGADNQFRKALESIIIPNLLDENFEAGKERKLKIEFGFKANPDDRGEIKISMKVNAGVGVMREVEGWAMIKKTSAVDDEGIRATIYKMFVNTAKQKGLPFGYLEKNKGVV